MSMFTNAYKREIVHPDDVELIADGYGPRWTNTVEVSFYRMYADEEIRLAITGSGGGSSLTIETAEALIEALQETVMLARLARDGNCNTHI